MVAKTKGRRSTGSAKRLIGKPSGRIQERVQAAGPQRFGIVAVDCAKRRSKWMLCDFYGRVVVEPTTAEHTAGGLLAMTQRVAEVLRTEGLADAIVAVEMTGIYHKPAYRAFRQAGFDTRIVHPFASNHFRRPLHPGDKTDDHIECHPYYRGLSALWAAQRVDPRDRRCRIANRAMRMVYQLVGGRQVWRGKGVDREYLLAKLQEFHRVHKTPPDQTIQDLHEAFAWLPKSAYAAEAKPLAELVRKKHRGPTRIGDLIVPLLLRLGVGIEAEVESSTSEARSSG